MPLCKRHLNKIKNMYKCSQCNTTAEVAAECQNCKVQMVESAAEAEVQPEPAAPAEGGEASPATENNSEAV